MRSLYPRALKSLYPRAMKSLYPRAMKSLYPRAMESLYPRAMKSLYPRAVKSLFPRAMKSLYPRAMKRLYPREVNTHAVSPGSQMVTNKLFHCCHDTQWVILRSVNSIKFQLCFSVLLRLTRVNIWLCTTVKQIQRETESVEQTVSYSISYNEQGRRLMAVEGAHLHL